jgi:hypothetical protein
MPTIWTDQILRRQDLQDLAASHLFLFGDNLIERGMGGMAAEMRGEPNSLGVPTKRLPSMTPDAFFSDSTYDDNVRAIQRQLAKIPNYNKPNLVIPRGIGAGRALLPQKAPRTYAALIAALRSL